MLFPETISKKLGISYPVIQAPMFGVSTPEMVAASADAGCLGSLALGDLPAEQCISLIRKTRSLTGRLFAVNIFVHEIPEITAELREKYAKAKAYIEAFAEDNGLSVSLTALEDLTTNSYHEQIEAIIDEGCEILSFTFGIPDEKSIVRLKEKNVLLIGTCTSVTEAQMLEKAGIDLIVVQGIEAGGHRGTFATESLPQIGGMSLLPQIADHVDTALIYSGGIYNAQTMQAAKALGAEGFQLGSMLLASQESALQPFEKDRLKMVSENDIVLTRTFSGRYARGISNKYIRKLEGSGFILPYPYQNKLTGALRNAAKLRQDTDFVSIWLGQSIHDYSRQSVKDILGKLIDDYSRLP
ncbi:MULTISPECIES: NAD(P)H-dependent flavin oxidoreductase [Chryseobacterium]|uniref:Propionate 3-nitronate monooxygenase n=1 Tax=Chryseobacterium camelliae TaxID=1265445 RepID=A0ABU0TJM0_9FLAO|nr:MULTISPECIES: nitronate monooxygenase [Chryseobacterium]MDT3408900.1 nitronate monooxygenase [Pseudacidovorax intermedius]MDQ1097243.1 nitronate monooxygenase [Chryseobacterium camelliae]MDQ1101178.1 nitronate monooxygenase [Chryseobacterium sp. SORGH_AS_1048]MDR6084623.1 nitronate monooxygenase [Chryseobacterium sp. SORGH_AS_0909]MDR6132895.1 nitronate monooxygenase [Chryseobacterium sp. SORGH_AS_1175]